MSSSIYSNYNSNLGSSYKNYYSQYSYYDDFDYDENPPVVGIFLFLYYVLPILFAFSCCVGLVTSICCLVKVSNRNDQEKKVIK